MRYALLSVVLLSACVAPVVAAKPIALPARDIALVQSAMSYDLYDPSAAQFRGVRAAMVTLQSGATVRRICGEMNGKNQYGAYVGYEHFSGVLDGGKWRQDPILGACEGK